VSFMILLKRLKKKMKPKMILGLRHSLNWLLKNNLKIWKLFKKTKKYQRNLMLSMNQSPIQLKPKIQLIKLRLKLKYKSNHPLLNPLKKYNLKSHLSHPMTAQLTTLLAHHLTPSQYSNKNNIIMQLKNKITVFDFKVTP
jgi:hypothetical protein